MQLPRIETPHQGDAYDLRRTGQQDSRLRRGTGRRRQKGRVSEGDVRVRIARAGVIEYSGDLLQPPCSGSGAKKGLSALLGGKKKTIRDRDDDSDDDD